MAMREEEETPGMEAESHSTKFLAKAEKMSKKLGKKGRKVSAHRDEKKRHTKKRTVKKRITKKL